jgi:cell division protein ZapE
VTENPLSVYESRLRSDGFKQDPAQRSAVLLLDKLWAELVAPSKVTWWKKLTGANSAPTTGIYMWGGVGRGKTWLMDLFYESLPFPEKQRIHFHRFMARVHTALRDQKDARNPLKLIAREWSENCRVLCFDEFFVSDIADAMLLGGLMEELFNQNVTLVATSNLPPGELYRDGLQRARFLPAIDSIKRNTTVIQVNGAIDYRLRILKKSAIYHYPLNADAGISLQKSFLQMAGGSELSTLLEFNGRVFQAKMRGDGVIWFDFDELCLKPRSTSDYIEISRSFNTVFLSELPFLDETSADATRRFINLVDEFYDRNVKLLVSAAASIEDIYQGERLAFEFQRTASRINEMQSHQYLAKPHLP